jgi:hypothetical protein
VSLSGDKVIPSATLCATAVAKRYPLLPLVQQDVVHAERDLCATGSSCVVGRNDSAGLLKGPKTLLAPRVEGRGVDMQAQDDPSGVDGKGSLHDT